MEKIPIATEHFINNWNGEFPNYTLSAADLKKPHAVIGALFQVFDRLGIDRDTVLTPPPEENRNEHTAYYWDLLPVINMTRVFNHLVSVMPQVDASISITHFLQPTVTTSHSILLLLFNLMVFNEDRLRDIEPHEEILFSKTDEIKLLEDKKNKLLGMLNEQAEEKGKRAERLEKLDRDIKQIEEELKEEKESHDIDKQELEAVLKENRLLEITLEQKKVQRDTLIAEIEKKQSLRVYDADDINAQAEQATQNVQEAEEKLSVLGATLLQKENNLMNLQNLKPNLDTANNLLHEIMKLAENLRDGEAGDLDTDSKEGELDVLETEVSELEAQLGELRVARADATRKRLDCQAKRQQQRAVAESCLRDWEEKDKESLERCKKATERVHKIKEATSQYELEKAEGFEKISNIKQSFITQLNNIEDALRKNVLQSKEKIEESLRNRNI